MCYSVDSRVICVVDLVGMGFREVVSMIPEARRIFPAAWNRWEGLPGRFRKAFPSLGFLLGILRLSWKAWNRDGARAF